MICVTNLAFSSSTTLFSLVRSFLYFLCVCVCDETYKNEKLKLLSVQNDHHRHHCRLCIYDVVVV